MKRLCPTCNSNKKIKLYYQKFSEGTTALIKDYKVVVCKNCGMIFADNIPSQEEFEEYYSKISRYELDINEGETSSSYINHNLKIFYYIIKYINKNSKILDIGCSTGTLLNIFKQHGFKNLYGIDPSKSCIKFLKDKYKIKGLVGNLSILPLLTEKFDLIILSSVIEHLVNIKEILLNLQKYLNPFGLIFIEVPDASRFKNYVYTPFQQFSLEHINYFTKISIKNLLKESNYQIININENINKGNQTIDPCFFIIAKKNIEYNSWNLIEVDKKGKVNIKKYIKKSKKLENKELKKIKKVFRQTKKLIVWGVGTNTQRILNKISINKISYFVDSNINYIGKTLINKEIKLPKEINSNEPILILSWSYQSEIIDQIKNQLKLKNEIITIYE